MTTTWEGGVEAVAAAAAAPVTGGGVVQEQVATERDPPVEEPQTSGNHLKVTPLCLLFDGFICQIHLIGS